MIVTIVSHKNQEVVQEAANESKMPVYPMLEIRISLEEFIKNKLHALQALDILILDLSVFTDDAEHFIQALKSLRVVYPSVQIILYAPEYKPGSYLLSQAFKLGIYDIITTNGEDAKRKIRRSLEVGMAEEEARIFEKVIEDCLEEEKEKGKLTHLFRTFKKSKKTKTLEENI